MPELKRILVATDFGPTAEAALSEACSLAEAFGAEIVLAHAVPPHTIPQFDGEAELESLVQEATGHCREIVAAHAAAGRNRILAQPVVKIGSPVDVILEAGEAWGVDLTLLGGGDRTALGALLFDPVLEQVMRNSWRPVWLVRPQNPHVEVKRILCAVDPARATGKALGVSLFLARSLGAVLELCTVVSNARGEVNPNSEQQDWLQTYLADYSSEEERGGIEVECLSRAGMPGARLVDLAAERESDLLVIGSGGRSGLRRWLRGDTAARVARQAPCSLLSVRTMEQSVSDSGRLLRITD